MKTLTSMAGLGIEVPNIEITRTSLDVLQGAGDQDYLRLEEILVTAGGAILWWWGDYLNHLSSARGIEYAEAKAASSYDPVTLRIAAWVCRHVARERRRAGLSFGHHREVAPLSPTDQEIWLDRAEDERWSVRALRAEIRKSKAQVQNGPDQAPGDQRAARASASYEEFWTWYQFASPDFSPEQQQEWDRSFERLVDDFLTRNRGHVVLRLKESGR